VVHQVANLPVSQVESLLDNPLNSQAARLQDSPLENHLELLAEHPLVNPLDSPLVSLVESVVESLLEFLLMNHLDNPRWCLVGCLPPSRQWFLLLRAGSIWLQTWSRWKSPCCITTPLCVRTWSCLKKKASLVLSEDRAVYCAAPPRDDSDVSA
jgi:hypothetical protein